MVDVIARKYLEKFLNSCYASYLLLLWLHGFLLCKWFVATFEN